MASTQGRILNIREHKSHRRTQYKRWSLVSHLKTVWFIRCMLRLQESVILIKWPWGFLKEVIRNPKVILCPYNHWNSGLCLLRSLCPPSPLLRECHWRREVEILIWRKVLIAKIILILEWFQLLMVDAHSKIQLKLVYQELKASLCLSQPPEIILESRGKKKDILVTNSDLYFPNCVSYYHSLGHYNWIFQYITKVRFHNLNCLGKKNKLNSCKVENEFKWKKDECLEVSYGMA